MLNIKTHFVLIGLTLCLIGCSTMPGNVSVTASKLDGERQVHVNPGWLYAGGMSMPEAKLGGFWSERSPTNFVLEAVVIGTESIEGLKIGIDGKVSEFKPAERLTDFSYQPGVYTSIASFPGHEESAKRFVVPLDYVTQMVTAKKVIVQIQMSRNYLEGEFSFNQQSYAKPAFRKALKQIQGPN